MSDHSVPPSPPHVPLTPAQRDDLAIELILTAQSLHATAEALERAALQLRPPRPGPSHIAPVFEFPQMDGTK